MKEKIKILLIDDEEPARILIKNYLEKHDDFELVGECEDGFQGAIKIKELKPDLVILDIQMPKLNGFEMLELIDNPPRIIFSTAYDEFALKAFEFGAADYLLKPFSQKRFDKALEKIIQKISEKPHPRESFAGLFNFVSSQQDIIKRIVVKNNNDIAIILTDNIERIESQDDYVFIYTFSGERYLKNSTMNYFEQHLDPKEFVRVHRTNIIRIDRISKIEIWEKDSQIAIMKSKEKVNISRSGYQRLREVLNM
ncbi:MAG: DNA-binding response regulator [Bacteroidetes bacterium CG2_30_33_31]|nr:MAG: DNA-binding response regulator [Bacteroidetes bacterium CG2_30_33_31]